MVATTRMSAREYLELPETNLPMELLEGEVIMTPAPADEHQHVSGLLHLFLAQNAPEGTVRYSPTDVVLDVDNVVQPDLFWVSKGSTNCILGDDHRWHGAPDLVIEILSPGTARRDRGDKFKLYERYGTREYWMVDYDAQYFEIYGRENNRLFRLGVFGPGESFESPLLGKRVDVSALLGLPQEPTTDQE